MYSHSIFVRLCLKGLLDVSRFAVFLSRTLLFLVAVELITMPVTQSIWTWDRFLHGGQDFELGLLIIITCFCLMLLQAEQCRDDLGLLLRSKFHLPDLRLYELHSTAVPRRTPERPQVRADIPPNPVDLPLLI